MLFSTRNRLSLLVLLGAMSVFVLALAVALAAQSGAPTFTVTSPAQGATVPSGIVLIEFAAQNFALGDQGQTHLHFYVDADSTHYDFYNGASGNTNQGVQYNGLHTHFVHWVSPVSIEMFGVAPGAHQVRFILANGDHSELANTEATKTLNFTVSTPPAGEFTLQPVLTSLNFPLSIAFAPDGRLFFNEWTTGRIRVVQANFGAVSTFFTVSNLVTGGERGLLGLALDPDFATNHFVYVYYTTSSPLRNKIIRLTDVNSAGTSETVIVDNLPASSANHNGGVIQFGPDGKLYVVIGDTENPNSSQSTSALSGKILRYNKDGAVPTGNPFGNSPVWAYGIRNSFGFKFHPHTGDLWESENGPDQDDEVNRIVPGGNYGWPNVTGIVNLSQYMDPIVEITPTIAPTGIVAVGENSNYPDRYHNNLLFTDFNNGQIHRIVLTGTALTQLGSFSVAYNGGSGSLLDIDQAPDGYIYVSSDSGIYRLTVSGDTTPPVLSSVASSGITSSGATITWTTDEASDSQVEYGTSTLYGNTTTLNTALVTSHLTNLSSLTTAGTLYHYRVRSRDAAGNLALSADSTFTTAVGGDTIPPTISAVGSSNVTTSGATITWTTDEASDTQVEYGTSTSYGSTATLNTSLVTSHSVNLSGLLANTLYHYRVRSRDAAGNLALSADSTFTTAVVGDTIPPAISAVASSNITSSGATITWTTDEASDSLVEFGTTASYGQITPLNTNLVGTHTIVLAGLAPSTTYHYRVRSKDAAGNGAVSGDFTFLTAIGVPASLGWFQIPNSNLTRVCPPDTPQYEFTFYCHNVVDGWSGGVADTARNRLIIWGGERRDYYGNEVYALNLNNLTMVRLNDPSPPNINGPCIVVLADGKPNTRENYNGLSYIQHADQMYLFSGFVACNGSFATNDTWTLNLATLQWTRKDPTVGIQPSINYYPNMLTAYDPNTRKVIVTNRSGQIYSYDYEANSYTVLRSTDVYFPLETTAVIDPKRKLFLVFGQGSFGAVDINAGSTYAPQAWVLTGCDALKNATVPGLAYDTAQDLIVGWVGGDAVYLFNPDTRSCTTVTYPGGPGAVNPDGSYGRFRYFPSLGVFALVNLGAQNGYNLRLTPPPSGGDSVAPTVAITSPADGATLLGAVTIAANAADNVGIAGVQFQLSGVALGAEVQVAPYQMTFNTVSVANGNYQLTAVARDASGNLATSSAVSISINNPDQTPPVITGPSATGLTTTGATITWTTNEPADSQLEYGTTTSYGSLTALDPALLTGHSVALAGLTASTTYHYLVKSRDAAGNLAVSADFSFATPAVPDTIAPSVSISAPTNGTIIRGTLSVTATANDNIGVAGVQFRLDSANLGLEDTSAPFQISWSTTTASNGPHALTAIARDAATNTTTSSVVSVTVDNSAPTVSMSSPAGGTSVSGTINVTATANDNVSVVGVQFKLDGSNLNAEDTSSPFQVSWNTASTLNGSHTLTAVARDAAGNQTTSFPVTVTVANSGTSATVTVTPVADAFVRSDNLSKNYGTSTELRIRQGNSSNPLVIRSYLKFTITGLSGTVTSAKLRLWITDAGTDRGSTYSASNSWTESAITWGTAPPLGILYSSGGSAPLGTWVEIFLPTSIFAAGNGDYAFAIAGNNTNTVAYSSRQGSAPPQLVLTVTP